MPTIETEFTNDCLLVGINRPTKRNALDEQMVDELHCVLDAAIKGPPKILVLYSKVDGVFISGADLSEMIERDADSALRSINAGLFEKIEKYRWPSVAAIDGYALGGGCELALACDFRIASTRAKFGQPELDLGIIAGAGGNWRLPQLVGLSIARKMLYAGKMLDAEEALSAGLVDDVVDSGGLMDEVFELANLIARRSWRALELTKLALSSTHRSSASIDIVAQALMFESDDKRSRMQAFLDKKK